MKRQFSKHDESLTTIIDCFPHEIGEDDSMTRYGMTDFLDMSEKTNNF